MAVLVIWILGVFRELKRVVLGVVWFCVFILLCKPCKPLVWRLEGLEEEVLELPQLGHVRLDKGAALVHRPPRLESAQLEAKGPDQPGWFPWQPRVLQVLGNGDHVRGVENHRDHRPALTQRAEEAFHCRSNVHLRVRENVGRFNILETSSATNLMRDQFKDFWNPDSKGC